MLMQPNKPLERTPIGGVQWQRYARYAGRIGILVGCKT